MDLTQVLFEETELLEAFLAGVNFANPDILVEDISDRSIVFRIGEDDNVTYKYRDGDLYFEAIGVEI